MKLFLLFACLVWSIEASILGTIIKIKEKLDQPGLSPKGQPFKKIKGPESFHTKIAIVGGGPAGVHMAYELKQRGYTNVTILESSHTPRIYQ